MNPSSENATLRNRLTNWVRLVLLGTLIAAALGSICQAEEGLASSWRRAHADGRLDSNLLSEDLATAISEGKVSARFRGLGGSSGDTVTVVITKTAKVAGPQKLTIPTGTRLQSADSSAQSMIVASIKGEVANNQGYYPRSVIEVGDSPTTYILDAYCAEFEKDNPSSTTGFGLGKVDPVLTCILTEAANLSTSAKQAAVWIYTDKASYAHMNQKFNVSKSDWDKAKAIVEKCVAKNIQTKKGNR